MKSNMRNLVLVLSLVTIVRSQEGVVRFGPADIKEILDTHNDLRRSVDSAANMRELTWNEGVALAASEWGSRCEYISRADNQWGQNMNYFYGNDFHRPAMELFRTSFVAWSNKTGSEEFRKYRYCGQKNVCSYVQLVAADVQELGCVIVKCPTLEFQAPYGVERHTKLLVCFYTPWVNILDEEVFIPDKRCAACPPGTTCVDNLCSARFYNGGKTKDISVLGAPSVAIESISGPPKATSIPSANGGTTDESSSHSHRLDPESRDTQRESRRNSRHQSRSSDREARRRERQERRRQRKKQRGELSPTDRVIGSHNTFQSPSGSDHERDNRVYQEHRGRQDTSVVHTDSSRERIVVYTPNNRVVPFPGRTDRRTIRKIEKYEAKNEKDLDKRQENLLNTLELVARNITIASVTRATSSGSGSSGTRKKRQVTYDEKVYQRRLEYQRYVNEYNRILREREDRRRQYEQRLYRRELEIRRQKEEMAQEMRARQRQNHQMAQELRQANGRDRNNNNNYDDYYYEQLRRQQERDRYLARIRRREQRLRNERDRYEALALTQNEGDLTGAEQSYTITAHNLLRREAGVKDLAWSSHLERWAKYVIRCDTEYPGPITCYTNFGKAGLGQEIYNVVYEWGTESNDLQRPIQYGCRTPYDNSLCNHNSIIREKSLSQMACASKQCGQQRQMTCIYSAS